MELVREAGPLERKGHCSMERKPYAALAETGLICSLAVFAGSGKGHDGVVEGESMALWHSSDSLSTFGLRAQKYFARSRPGRVLTSGTQLCSSEFKEPLAHPSSNCRILYPTRPCLPIQGTIVTR